MANHTGWVGWALLIGRVGVTCSFPVGAKELLILNPGGEPLRAVTATEASGVLGFVSRNVPVPGRLLRHTAFSAQNL